MGYVSDVCIALTKEAYENFKNKYLEILKDIKPEADKYSLQVLPQKEYMNLRNSYLKNFIDKIMIPEHVAEDNSVLLSFSGYKWYENEPQIFPEIYAFQKAIQHIDSNEFLFIRIGEFLDDYEICGSYCDNPFNLEIRREISYNAPILNITEDEKSDFQLK